jgi:CRP-like cAMP-binding protein
MEQLFRFFDSHYVISPQARAEVARLAKPVSLKKNELLQEIGRTCKTIYFIKKGMARIFYYKDGKDITESFAFENSIVARVESLFTGMPSRKAIQVLEDTKLIAINSTELFKLYDKYPDLERLIRKITESAYVETVNRVESMQFHSAEERYNDLLRKAPDLVRRVPLKYISSYLGITQVSLSRIRAKH